MDLEGIMLSKISQRERQTLYYLTYMWNLKNKTNSEKEIRFVVTNYKINKYWGWNVQHDNYN